MLVKNLHGSWKMRISGEDGWSDAIVPGSVMNDLMEQGRMEDPYYRDNELKALEWMEHDFEYQTVFGVGEEILERERILLRMEGIDTVAEITLNGALLGKTENMHRTWEFDVTGLLVREENCLHVLLRSPTRYIQEAYEKDPVEGSAEAMRGFPLLRKAHCMFGWDWGPRLPDAGIWRDVLLLGCDGARFDQVHVRQQHEAGRVRLIFNACVEGGSAGDICRISVWGPDGKLVREKECSGGSGDVYTDHIIIEEPELWWPAGFGDQPLYRVRAELLREGRSLDIWGRRIGLRTMTVSRQKFEAKDVSNQQWKQYPGQARDTHGCEEEYGEQFAHEINGIRIFAMGADYIPEDNILSRMCEERTRELLLQCREANFNVIRVWGGGIYPPDYFYDICDELGLVVWQDFMFACAVYHLTGEFEENIRAELTDNIRRIRHHACLGLWCGNNEMEQFVREGRWGAVNRLKSDYVKMYEYIFPKILEKEDPDTFYWPSSPSCGGGFDNPNDEKRGDVHYWDVWHGGKPFTDYRRFCFRYVSEFGFQSFPSLKTIETFTLPEERNVFSYVMEKHQRNGSANGKIMAYMEQTFLYPSDLDTFVYASQLLQAEAIRYGVEHFRRNRGRCMGAVIWQLNDCWPAASWSSIDYYGRWKALHYYARRFFAPLMISCEEEGMLSQDPNINAQPYELRKSFRLCVANETRLNQQTEVRWTLRSASGTVKKGGSAVVEAQALSSRWLERVEVPEADEFEDYVSYEMRQEGELTGEGTVLFVPPKFFRFRDPLLKVWMEGTEIVVSADAYARGVEIRNEEDDLILSDNFFDMNPGVKKVRILKGKPEGLRVRSVFDIR